MDKKHFTVSGYQIRLGRHNTNYYQALYLYNNNSEEVALTFTDNIAHPNVAFTNGNYRVYLRRDQYEPMLDTLRNEKPVRALVIISSNFFRLYTGKEEVGEGELDL